ncbi:VOC family protein [Pelagicoccus mobilis]|uniref:VOC family protein n=1 Tax=Pelagicoccus mobilis TaxID=415221 RepID=A0A934RWQ1_9BACT|nr:VOC family protein [Pelagicoccus mobilis]MBK1876166.1 VOC family protein [Pelagicoccus mobilis]
MRIEHIAINVAQPKEVAAWYIKNCDMKIAREVGGPAEVHFLSDSSGNTLVEIYNNPKAAIPNYADQHPLILHFAFVSENADADRSRLEAAGATFVVDETTPAGDRLVMLRDPWGLAIQLCCRKTPMI